MQIRLDKWLWHARFFKTRSLATKECKARRIRLNGTHVTKASTMVGPDDILSFPKAGRVYVVKVVAPGERRGPASEAVTLYEDLSPPPDQTEGKPAGHADVPLRERGAGRPTKAERRAIDRLMNRYDENS